MAELPPIPTFDPNAPPAAAPTPAATPAAATAPEAAAPDAAAAALPKVARPAARRPAPAGEAAPHVVTAPGAPPAAPTTVSAVQDSVEEVLQQTSAQALQLSHLEDVLSALNQTLHDLQEEMHAGFLELRAVVESQATASLRATAVAGSQSATQRLDYVEEKLEQGQKRQSLLFGIAAANLALLCVLLILALTSRPEPPAPELPVALQEEQHPAEPRAAEPTVDDSDARLTPADDATRGKKKKRRR